MMLASSRKKVLELNLEFFKTFNIYLNMTMRLKIFQSNYIKPYYV